MTTDNVAIPVTEARGQLTELVNRVAYSGDHITLTRHGRPMAVLVSVSDAQRAREILNETGPAGVSSLTSRSGHTPTDVEHRYRIAAQTDSPVPRSGGRRPGSGSC